MKENFKDIPGYEGYYQVSNLGRVKSLSRKQFNGHKYFIKKEKMLKPGVNSQGYLMVVLCKNTNNRTKKVHILVGITFLGFKQTGCGGLVMDHINNIKSDNRIENLQIITQRENCSKDQKNGTSEYAGVNWYKRHKKWRSQIRINSKQTHLGYFDDELEAHNAYKEAVKNVDKFKQ